MGLIQDQRPRDWAYKAVFKEKDLPSLEAMAKHIRETHDVSIIEDFNAKCEQKLSEPGQKVVLDNGLEIEAVTKSEDLVLNAGLQQCINIILGTSSTRWSHFGFGTGGLPPGIIDTVLAGESVITRVTLAWAESVGMRLFFGGISSQTDTFRPNAVVDMGVYNGSAAGAVLLNRSQFAGANQPTQDVALFSNPSISTAPILVSAVIEFCPVV